MGNFDSLLRETKDTISPNIFVAGNVFPCPAPWWRRNLNIAIRRPMCAFVVNLVRQDYGAGCKAPRYTYTYTLRKRDRVHSCAMLHGFCTDLSVT